MALKQVPDLRPFLGQFFKKLNFFLKKFNFFYFFKINFKKKEETDCWPDSRMRYEQPLTSS